MKKKISQLAAVGFFMLLSFAAYSQQPDPSVPGWVSEKGYWVVEGNIYHPLQHTIRFYNNQHIMIASRKITSKRLNVRRKKVKMQLKSMLESSLQEWAARQAGTSPSDVAGKP